MNAEKTEAIASRWLAKRESGQWTEADQAEFEVWYEVVPNRVEFIRLEIAWQQSARLQALGAGVPPGVVPPRGSWGDARFPGGGASNSASVPEPPISAVWVESRGVRSFRRRYWAMAAAVLLATAGGTYVLNSGLLVGDSYSTSVGGLNDVRLSDGSHITLNTDTSIRVVLSKTQRRVDLDKGEAFFEVAKDPSRPFVVTAGDKRVMAVGTKFSVRRESDDVQVVVTEGRVKLATYSNSLLSTSNVAPSENASGSAGSPATLLPAGTVARTKKAAVLVHEQASPEAEDLLSWRNGYVIFKDTTVADAVNEFNRYNTRKIIIEDVRIARIRIGGNFRSNNVGAFLSLLEDGFPIEVDETEDRVVLKSR